MPRRDGAKNRAIQPGDAGIWATCAMNKEGKSVADLRDLFQEVSRPSKLHDSRNTLVNLLTGNSTLLNCMGQLSPTTPLRTTTLVPKGVISKLRSRKRSPTFVSLLRSHCLHRSSLIRNAVRTPNHSSGAPCSPVSVIFFRTRSPIEPVCFVHQICQELADGAQPRNLRYVKRLTPITTTDKATPQGLETVAKQVLGPHFHGTDQAGKKVSLISCYQMMQPRCAKIFANVR
jgi:tRNA acetyltransferase TAN1